LSSNHDRILYIQADDGYSFVHLDDVKQPKILSLTLRTIKYFFDDETYLQIHRSCIINPDKVKKVQQPQKMKFEVVLNNKKIPLSRAYVASLKVRYPQWFLESKS
jgi:DNA-binding LytR/AlgR family response regulator